MHLYALVNIGTISVIACDCYGEYQMKRLQITITLLLCCVLLCSVYAAIDGSLGATSSGSLTLTQVVTNMVKVSGLGDLTFTSITGEVGGPQVVTEQFCVHSNLLSRGYKIQMTSNHGSYKLKHSNGVDELNYTVEIDGQASGANAASVPYNSPSATYSGSAATDCAAEGGVNAFIRVTIPAAEFANALAGSYTAQHTITATPI